MIAVQASTTEKGTMRAVVQHEYGRAPEEVLRLERIAIPAVSDGEVLVRVRAAGVDRGTWHLMAGLPYLARYIGFGLRAPKSPVPGVDLAGTVVAVGAKVTGVGVGDDVFGTGKGAFAEYAVARADRLVVKPAELAWEQAAAVTVSATAALQAVRKAQVEAGDRVLVIGASGGVGSYAVQLAKASGAQVTGVASTAKVEFVRSLGADDVIDYTVEDVTDGRRRYDVIIDIAGNRPVSALRRALTPRGRLVITGGENGGSFLGGIERNLRASLLSPFVRQRLGAFVSRLRGDDLLALRNLVQAGAVVPPVDRVFALEDAAAAVRYLADGRVRGKVVISVR